ncbi:hypothetical protein PHET_00250 [Paragonimus heterotremus]|uniref:Uncharacterized protein n=1 Tax=Paragonimus heterotremus TaxID=100268 RepID=A0A8J4TNW9_9TREM|nr:hypothetical protein PHET_00250 [Paragonimus heterotremus]
MNRTGEVFCISRPISLFNSTAILPDVPDCPLNDVTSYSCALPQMTGRKNTFWDKHRDTRPIQTDKRKTNNELQVFESKMRAPYPGAEEPDKTRGELSKWLDNELQALYPVPEKPETQTDKPEPTKYLETNLEFPSELDEGDEFDQSKIEMNPLSEIGHLKPAVSPPNQTITMVTVKPTESPLPHPTVEQNVTDFPLVPREKSEHMINAIRLLTANARNFMSSLETINEKNYRSMTEFLKRHAGSGLQTADYGVMLQSWKLVATGSEELTEQFLRKMSLLATMNRTIEHTTAILLGVKTYIQAYISNIVKRQNLMMDTAFSLVNQPSLSQSEFQLLENLLNFHQQVHTHSFRTMNTYIELLNRLADIKK